MILQTFKSKRLLCSAIILLLPSRAFCEETEITETNEKYSVSRHAEMADDFISRTIDRMNAAWCGCRDEFTLAGYCVKDKPNEIGRDVSARADAAVDNAKDRISGSMRDFVDDAGDAVKDSADEAIYSAKDAAYDFSDKASDTADDVSDKAAETSEALKENVNKHRGRK